MHAREYQTHFLVHRDIADPTTNPIEHLIFDVAPPEVSKHSKTISRILLKMQNSAIEGAQKRLLKSSQLKKLST
ncbi:MAG: hypothetical protein QW791_06350 [Candidatus Bathyarchaeia archaeon]